MKMTLYTITTQGSGKLRPSRLLVFDKIKVGQTHHMGQESLIGHIVKLMDIVVAAVFAAVIAAAVVVLIAAVIVIVLATT